MEEGRREVEGRMSELLPIMREVVEEMMREGQNAIT